MPDLTLLDEVRLTRHRIAAECGNDLRTSAKRAAEAALRFSNGAKSVSIPVKRPGGADPSSPLFVAEAPSVYDADATAPTP